VEKRCDWQGFKVSGLEFFRGKPEPDGAVCTMNGKSRFLIASGDISRFGNARTEKFNFFPAV